MPLSRNWFARCDVCNVTHTHSFAWHDKKDFLAALRRDGWACGRRRDDADGFLTDFLTCPGCVRIRDAKAKGATL